jgi:TonB-dependent starch-binding outer membrane protein SusC
MRKLLCLTALMMLLCAFRTQAQTREISGKISDIGGVPISGATITIKNTRTGTVAGDDGSFKMNAPANAVLVISAVGYESSEINIGTRTAIVVSLVAESKSLNEVVVTGTGAATSKKKLGFSVESIRGDKLPVVPSGGIDQALVGKVPGAQISTVSGNPGDQVNIVLRGINTIQGGTRPMILLDGTEVPFYMLNTLDLTQVDKVEVVQGSASSALYGAQGANGVIQIFTKKGVKGHTSINLTTSIGQNIYINAGDFGKADKHPYLTNASGQIVSANNSGGFTAGQPLSIDPTLGVIPGSGSLAYVYGSNISGLPGSIPGLTQNYTRYGILDPRNQNNQSYGQNLKYYDHFAQVFRNGLVRNNTVNINGGGEKNDFAFTMSNNHTESALLENNGYVDRTNIVVNLGFEVLKNLTFRTITNLAYTFNNLHPHMGAPGGELFGTGRFNADVGGVYGFLNTSPFFSLKDTIVGGYYAPYQRASFASVNAFNPYYRLEYTAGDAKRYDIVQNFIANYKVNRFVSLEARYGVNHKSENDYWTFYNQSLNANSNVYATWTNYYNGNDNTGEIDNFQYLSTNQNFYTGITGRVDFEKDLKIHVPIQSTTLAGFDYRKSNYKEVDSWGQTLQLSPPYNLTSTQQQFVSQDYIEKFVTYGYLLDEKIDYGNLAGISGGFRSDYSSAFGRGSKPFTFPHYNGYVNISEFKFWNKTLQKRIPTFKLRAAYGKAGIQPFPFDRYPGLDAPHTGNEATYANQVSSRNPALDVEVSTEKEAGTDIGFNLLKGNWLKSILINYTVWTRNTDNGIFTVNVAPSTGATSLKSNSIKLASSGWQVGVNMPILTSKNWAWDFNAGFGHQNSWIDAIQGGDIPLTTAAGSSGLILKAGYKIGQIFGYKALTSVGQFRADGKTPFIDPSLQANYEVDNGRVVNKTTKAIFFSDEASALGDPNPSLTSYGMNVTFKNFITLAWQLDWIMGSHLYEQTKEWMYRDAISKDFTKPITINGQTGAWTAYYASAYYALGNTPKGVGNNVTKDFFYSDASFARLRNLSLGVDFARFIKKSWMKKCQLILSGRNLFTITKYDGLDPEISSGQANSSFDRGIDHSTIPNLKAYQVTLNLGF